MLVVADASPINILIRLGHVDLLPALFGGVLTTPGVLAELSAAGTTTVVHRWVTAPPSWLRVQSPAAMSPHVAGGLGEREAISLAARLGLVIMGTLGVYERAAARGLVDLGMATDALQRTDFRLDKALVAAALERDAARRR